MSRPLRIEYPNAWYHVMNRGANKQKIFCCEKHYHLFLDLLSEIHNRYQVEIHAYCLMPNHYHLLICTPLPNLSRAMRHLDGLYTQRYNSMQKSDGPLFRGRYKSIIIEANNYLLRLSRYIHMNPVVANIIKKPKDYLWSSYSAYIKSKKCPRWLNTKATLNQFGSKMQKQKYRLFIEEGIDNEMHSFFNKVKVLPIMGSEAFTKTISEKYLRDKKLLPEINEHKLLANTIDVNFIIKSISAHYKINANDLLTSKRSNGNKPRTVAIYLACKISGEKLPAIAEQFSLKSYSSISQSYYRTSKSIKNDKNLEKEIIFLEEMLLEQFPMSNVKT